MFLRALAVVIVTYERVVHARRALRVHHGHADDRHEFPFIVLLQDRAPPFPLQCTGSLISETWVLTTAHCLGSTRAEIARAQDVLLVKYGEFALPDSESRAKVLRGFVPHVYLARANAVVGLIGNDIGLLQTERISKPIAMLLAVDSTTLFGLPVKFAGFGHTSIFPSTLNNSTETRLRVGEGVLVPCSNFRDIGRVVCVEPKCSNKLQGARAGDSGGPLVYDGRVVGVTKGPSSWELRNKGGTSFTPVSVNLEWIKHVMSSNRDSRSRPP